MSENELAWPEAACCAPNYPMGCICTAAERACRAWKRGHPLPPMTDDQRKWCLAQIASVEGYRAEDYENATDAFLAGGVLNAWTDYAYDKGLLP